MSVPNLTGPKIEVYMNEPVKKPIEFHGGESKLPNGEHAITVAWSPYLGLMAGWRGVSETAAQHMFSLNSATVEVFIGQRIVFQTLADFDDWRRKNPQFFQPKEKVAAGNIKVGHTYEFKKWPAYLSDGPNWSPVINQFQAPSYPFTIIKILSDSQAVASFINGPSYIIDISDIAA